MQSTIQRLNVKMRFNHDAMRDEKNNNFINKAKVALRSNNCFSNNFKVHLCFKCGARYLLFTFLQVQERGTLNNIDHILFLYIIKYQYIVPGNISSSRDLRLLLLTRFSPLQNLSCIALTIIGI